MECGNCSNVLENGYTSIKLNCRNSGTCLTTATAKKKAISLFSGAGGDTLGMKNAGIDVVGFVEFNKDAIKSHEINFPSCKLIGEDITKIQDEVFMKYKDNIDVIFGGFPCQAYSQGGRKNPKDSRAYLYEEFVRVANIIRPKYIIGENVVGLKSRKMPDGKFFLDDIKDKFKEIGYSINFIDTFNSENYGIPQLRRRVIIIGTLDNSVIPEITHEPMTHRFIKDILEPSLDGCLELKKEEIIKMITNFYFIEEKDGLTFEGTVHPYVLKCYNDFSTSLPEMVDGKYPKIYGLSYGRRIFSTYGEIVNINKYSKTIICSYARMPRMVVPIKYKNKYYIRMFTVRELQQIQGFPTDFVFHGNKISQIAQIGNAVPPPIIQKIIETLLL